jgi:hypothetical protein
VTTIPNALERVLGLRGINFRWNDSHIDGDSLQIGMIAQEVEALFPEAVHTAKDKMRTKSVDYEHLSGALVEAVKEMHGLIEEKDCRIEEQRAEIDGLNGRLARLEAFVANLSARK